MNAAAERSWSEHQPVQPNAANVVPQTEEEAAEYFRCLTYRCGMLGRACAGRFQKRAAGPVLGQVDHLNGCHGCAAGQARATLLAAAPGVKVKHVGIARGNPIRSKFQPVLASRKDRNLGTVTSLLDPCAECNAERTRTTRGKADGPYAALCGACAGRRRYQEQRQAVLAQRAAQAAFRTAIDGVLERLRAASSGAALAQAGALEALAFRRAAVASPFVLPEVPVLFVPAANCAGCGRARKYTPRTGRPDFCRRCNEKADAAEAAKERLAPRLPDPPAPCSKCGAERHFTQKRRRPVGDPTACARCNRHVHRAIRRREQYVAKSDALKARLLAAQAGEFDGCVRCFRQSRCHRDRVGTPLEHFCSDCVAVAFRFVRSSDPAARAAWLIEHPSRRDHGHACRGCGAMRHKAGDGPNGEWCSRCQKDAANSARWHGVAVTEDTMHQQLLRVEERRKRSKRVPDGTVQFWVNRESEYLGGVA